MASASGSCQEAARFRSSLVSKQPGFEAAWFRGRAAADEGLFSMSELVHGGGRMIPADVPPTEIEQAAFDFEQVVQKLGGLRAALLGASAQAIETEVMGLECILEQLNARDQTV